MKFIYSPSIFVRTILQVGLGLSEWGTFNYNKMVNCFITELALDHLKYMCIIYLNSCNLVNIEIYIIC